jgi:putative ABC transport system substrate-binding protein
MDIRREMAGPSGMAPHEGQGSADRVPAEIGFRAAPGYIARLAVLYCGRQLSRNRRGDRMRRREFITLLASTAAAWPHPARAQQRKALPRVGVLWHAGNAKEEAEYLGALTKAFHELGYVEGKNVELDHRFPAEQPERYRALAQELAESKVDVIVAVTGLGAREAKRATGTIPIVLVADPDPVGNGLAESLAHPGGNVTGLSLMAIDLSGKRLALFKEAVPKLARVAILGDPRDPFSKSSGVAYERAAKPLGLSTQMFEVVTKDEIEQAFSVIARDGFDGACVTGAPLYNERVQVGASAMAHKVPTLAGNAEQVPYNLLLSYGPDFPDYFRRAVGYVDKILKGAKPGDLPIEQPTRFKLVINLKTAKALGLSVPPSLVATADEVIE